MDTELNGAYLSPTTVIAIPKGHKYPEGHEGAPATRQSPNA